MQSRQPEMIERPIYLPCSMIWSRNFPLADAAQALRHLFTEFVDATSRMSRPPGIEWIDGGAPLKSERELIVRTIAPQAGVRR
jgi:hypothetical protein